jgi:selenide,water dikinase
LLEVCQGSNVRAELKMENIPRIDGVDEYIAKGCIPGGTDRNFASYGEQMQPTSDADRAVLCDPQTSGGLLVAVTPQKLAEFEHCVEDAGLELNCIGELLPAGSGPALFVSQ